MTRFDLDKLLEAADAKVAEEEKVKLLVAMNAIIDQVTVEADQAARTAFEAQANIAKQAQLRNEKFEDSVKQHLVKIEETKQNAVTTIGENGSEIVTAINSEGGKVETKVSQLKATRVMAELAWNNLPKKIALGVAVFSGVVIGAGLTVLVAAAKQISVKTQTDVAQIQLEHLQSQLQYWDETAGFELIIYRGKPIVRLDDGLKFKQYTPRIGVLSAGNLWDVVPK